MSTLTRRWFAFVTVEDRSGASTALTGVFSERGVSFGSISTLDVHDGMGTLSVEFAASERLAHVLVRTLARLSVVRDATLVAADDSRVRAVAMLTGGTGDEALPAEADVHRHGEGPDATTIVMGRLSAVEAAVATMRGSGCAVEAITVLPPR
ncbi:hypothetical protein RN607_11545 [Demequina capsici]|uniref:ACT domain-containing protein n=1 Tax=Demequina capsici TaxID=3075620 RepID=A0AA96FE74_9MICO|nr:MULTISPECIES: hypothetical protein [unclassified Demequina]WNM23997.1 hypothetical protein RN606_11605 [Demequina sp. OYTSA14]WNM26825.1 hypothetical protein RN607_11545 [Demequina sp. PMTSA13]